MFGKLFNRSTANAVSSSKVERKIQEHKERAEQLQRESQYEAALTEAARVRDLVAKNFGRVNREYVWALRALGVLKQQLGNYQAAEELFKEAHGIVEKEFGPEDVDTGRILYRRGMLYGTLRDREQATSYLGKALAIFRKELGQDDAELRQSEQDLAEVEERFAARRKEVNPNAQAEVSSLCRTVAQLTEQGRYDEAMEPAQRAVAFAGSYLGEEHPDTLASLSILANVHFYRGSYEEAEPLLKRVLAVSERVLGLEHLQTLTSVNNLAVLYQRQGRCQEAELLFERALAASERLLGEEHSDTLTSVNNLAALYQSQGRYQEAELLFERALAASERLLGEEHSDTLSSVNNLAVLYTSQGRYEEAELLFERALAARERVLGKEHPQTLTSVNNLAELYTSQGRYEEAEPLFERALAVSEQLLGADHPQTLMSVNNLSKLYSRQERYEEAEPLFEWALAVSEQLLGADHPDTLTSANNLAVLYQEQGRYEEAEPLFERALAVSERVLGAHHPNTVGSVNNLAGLYARQGRYEDAKPLQERARAVSEHVFGAEHPNTLMSMNNLGELCWSAGKPLLSFDLLARGQTIQMRLLLRQQAIRSTESGMLAIGNAEGDLFALVSLVWQEFRDSATHVAQTAEIVFRRKGLVLEAVVTQREELLSGRYPQQAQQLRELFATRARFVRKTLAGPSPGEDPEQHRTELHKWEAWVDGLERDLSRQIPELGLEEKLAAVNSRALADALPEGALLVEFLRFRNYDPRQPQTPWKEERYVAFVLAAGKVQAVRMVDLGEAEPIDEMVRSVRLGISGEQKDFTDGQQSVEPWWRAAERLYEAVIDPLRADRKKEQQGAGVLTGSNKPQFFLAPDGELSLLPFEVLRNAEGRYLGDEYEVSYLGNGRDLLRLQENKEVEAGDPVVVADPAFDLMSSAQNQDETGDHRGLRGELGGKGISFDPLPGTRFEGERIANRLRVKPWMDAEVMKARFKAIRNPRVLHAATHGYFLSDQELLESKEGQRLSTNAAASRLHEAEVWNPMLRSGLALAGSNSWLKREPLPEEAEDGLLTAEDVAMLDLRGTELVVLSACDTGLGQVRHGEGVFGLRRAFLLAGARSLVMSLWRVDDLAAALLMDQFYDNLLVEKMSRSQALQSAQRYLRRDVTVGGIRAEWLNETRIDQLSGASKEVRAKLEHWRASADETRPFRDPFYWASFILQGDTGPLRLDTFTTGPDTKE